MVHHVLMGWETFPIVYFIFLEDSEKKLESNVHFYFVTEFCIFTVLYLPPELLYRMFTAGN